MTDKKEPLVKVMTEKGIAVYPCLNKPDTKFNPDGEYKTGVRYSAEDAEPIVKLLKESAQKAFDAAKADLEEKVATEKGEKKAKAKKALDSLELGDLPVKPAYDEEGNETGEVILTFKMKAQRKDKKTGKVIKMAPKLFDAAGKAMASPPEIWGGSIIKVAGLVNTFYVPGTNVAGASLRLSAVQVLELRSSGGGDAASYGFGKEDGYEAPEDATSGSTDDDLPEAGDDPDNDDF